MNDNNPKRRWFQYSLRSVLLLMLGVGLWLGYEVNWASRQQRHVAAIKELGGSVEYESHRWSLLRFYDAKKYGRTLSKAKIPGTLVAEAKPHLEGLSHLRQLSVVFDGTSDLYPHLNQIRAAFPEVVVMPVGDVLGLENQMADSEWARIRKRLEDRSLRIWKRLQTSVRWDGLPTPRTSNSKRAKALLDYKGLLQWGQFSSAFRKTEYGGVSRIEVHLVPLADGATAEIIHETLAFSGGPPYGGGPTSDTTTMLLVRDRFVDVYPLHGDIDSGSTSVHLDDVDGDGWIDFVNHWQSKGGTVHEVYGIDSQGFHLMEGLSTKQQQRAAQRTSSDAR